MECVICGDSSAEWRNEQLSFQCAACSEGSAPVLPKSEFDRFYWGSDLPDAFTRRQFYEDYRASGLTAEEYLRRTTSFA